jgi:mono/diheme cytochrome c family protein
MGGAFAVLWAAVACSGGDDAGEDLAARGKAVYQNYCIACHNANPAKDGGVGPAIAGSSQQLLEYRVLNADYPPGYTPKRPSAAMPSFPYLKDEIPALAAYLADPS